MTFDLNWWNASVFCIIPVLSVVIILTAVAYLVAYTLKRKNAKV